MISVFGSTECVNNDVCQTEKSQIAPEAQAVYHSLVSKQPELLREPGRQKAQASTDPAAYGPQGRMAPLTPSVSLSNIVLSTRVPEPVWAVTRDSHAHAMNTLSVVRPCGLPRPGL